MRQSARDRLFVQVQEAILRIFDTDAQERRLPEVISLVGATGADEATIKAAVLRLTSEGRLEFTPDWKFKTVAQIA